MKTNTNRKLLAFGAVVIVCLITVWLSTTIGDSCKRYEVKPEITLPEFATDTAHVIYAYEHIMDRLMYLTENNLNNINTEVKDIAEKLGSIESKITELSTRIERIENALGIEQPKNTPSTPKKSKKLN